MSFLACVANVVLFLCVFGFAAFWGFLSALALRPFARLRLARLRNGRLVGAFAYIAWWVHLPTLHGGCICLQLLHILLPCVCRVPKTALRALLRKLVWLEVGVAGSSTSFAVPFALTSILSCFNLPFACACFVYLYPWLHLL